MRCVKKLARHVSRSVPNAPTSRSDTARFAGTSWRCVAMRRKCCSVLSYTSRGQTKTLQSVQVSCRALAMRALFGDALGLRTKVWRCDCGVALPCAAWKLRGDACGCVQRSGVAWRCAAWRPGTLSRFGAAACRFQGCVALPVPNA